MPWILGLVALLQVQTPIFRAGVDVVPIVVAVAQKNQPYLDLTPEDFTIMLDRKPYAPVEVARDPKLPGCYFVNFKPPEASLDGKHHRIELKVKNHSPKWTRLTWMIRIPANWTTEHPVPPGSIPPKSLIDTFGCRKSGSSKS